MKTAPNLEKFLSKFLYYLSSQYKQGTESILKITELSNTLGVSPSVVREQLEVAKSLGLVEVKPRTGIKLLPYSFKPAIVESIAYAINININYFEALSNLRNHIESCYWHEAVNNLTIEDIVQLRALVDSAISKLTSDPITIPQTEHREFHLKIFQRINNIFVTGILEAYWDMYDAVGLTYYLDRTYLTRVWNFHKEMVVAIEKGDAMGGYQALIKHMNLLNTRTNQLNRFE